MKPTIHASVKDEKLIALRRSQLINGAMSLFKQKGFHRTTTREIAKEAGFSIGTLYEYIRTKEDILYLVCDSIYGEVRTRLESVITSSDGSLQNVIVAMSNYFKVMNDLQDEVLFMYQEVHSLSKESRKYVLQKELDMVRMFEVLLSQCVKNNVASLTETEVKFLSNTIFVQGQMWAFRRWVIQKLFTMEEYITMQATWLTEFIQSKGTGVNK
ncbi:TetR/AcrR family transcriptional regulator [Priestia taiwanensis]|uniref:TetR family transcriptional regulator n=1 Tax=Priestia taiwanensis TaxID=1347902 RepID=A0A917AWH8_9BACI|nr:TetR/AcrR family transcriptional regulator [Priestia taiwanensis]MBM7364967.1 AcrR family transcriptional regulator [Priestia taiwanensis]GGE82142.1 TetR family transcriptional regulator [Priestia taiwanensis]